MDNKITEAAKQAHWWFSAMLGGAVGLILVGMGMTAYFGSFASASTVARHETAITEIKAVLPLLERDVASILEIERAEQWRLHRIVIPDVASPDGGIHR